MRYSALIGNPTGHSVSHVMYEEIAKIAQVPGEYRHIKIDLEEAELKSALRAFKTLHCIGLNVTLPHKLAVMPLLDEVDETAEQLGAVNTVRIRETLRGYNTDWRGIYEPLRKRMSNLPNTVTIFGSGGAARAAIYAAKKLGATKINVLYRDETDDIKTEDLQKRQTVLGIQLHKYTNVTSLVDDAQLVINATSAGMVGKDETPFNLALLDTIDMRSKTYLDAVFNPVVTPLLSYFDKRKAQTVDGLWMMLYQGVAAMELWLDTTITLDDAALATIHDRLREELQHV